MNAEAITLGLSHTVFANVTGQDAKGRAATAYGLARPVPALLLDFPSMTTGLRSRISPRTESRSIIATTCCGVTGSCTVSKLDTRARPTVKDRLYAPAQYAQAVGTLLDIGREPFAQYSLVALKQIGTNNLWQRPIDHIQLWRR
ncbi:MAG TPA: hypothetical protein VEI74_05905 [Candidatus Methylomirabilis sp.]|nr:hypothetical protein [Candidatus Methylomirabilis sp.]